MRHLFFFLILVSSSLNAVDSVDQLQKELLRAQEKQLSVTMKGSQHSQGGHTKADIVIDLSGFKSMELIAPRVLRVGAQATCKEVDRKSTRLNSSHS